MLNEWSDRDGPPQSRGCAVLSVIAMLIVGIGIVASIAMAVEHLMPMRRVRGILLCLADMPDVPQTHYNRICLAAEDIRSVVASTDGFSSSAPAFIGRKHFPELQALRGDQGPRALLSHGVQVETSGAMLHDVNAPQDLPDWRPPSPPPE